MDITIRWNIVLKKNDTNIDISVTEIKSVISLLMDQIFKIGRCSMETIVD